MKWRLPRLMAGLVPRIVGLVALTALISGGLIGLISVHSGRGALQDQILADSQAQADLSGEFTRHYVSQAEDAMRQLAGTPGLGTAIETQQYSALAQALPALRSVYYQFENVSLVLPSGEVVARAVDTGAPASNVSDREWFFQVIQTRQAYLGLPVQGRTNGKPVAPYAVPIFGANDQVIAMIVGSISLQGLTDALAFANTEPDTRVSLVDTRQGSTLIADKDPAQIPQPFAGSDTVRGFLRNGDHVATPTQDRDGQDALVAVSPIANLPWAVVIEEPAQSTFAPLDNLTHKVALLSLVVILVACLLSGWLALVISRPLSRLRQAIQSLASGDLRARLGFTGQDEIGAVGRAFDGMATVLEHRTEDLELAISQLRSEVQARQATEAELAAARDVLEVRVTERTAELTETNQALEKEVAERLASEEALRISENRFRLLVDGVRDYAIYRVDPDGRVGTWNPGAERMTGYTTNEILELDHSVFYTPEDLLAGLPQQLLDAALGQGSVESEGWRRRKNGSRFWAAVMISPLYDEDGSLRGFANIIRDTTERRELEQAIERSIAELRRSNAELEQFAYVASHDLQEPLRMISNYTQLLARRYQGQLDDDADVFIGYAVEGAGRMQQLINDLLTFSRVGTRGKDFTSVDLETVIDIAQQNLSLAIEDSGAEVTHDPLPSIVGDDTQLLQLFQNLIANAIKFHGEAPPHVHIGAEKQGEDWHFTVRDNGIGIDPQFHERVFIIFQRLHGRGEYAGTGIGLAICRRIAERHGGRIWVESTQGEGATFHIVLPQTSVLRAPVAAQAA